MNAKLFQKQMEASSLGKKKQQFCDAQYNNSWKKPPFIFKIICYLNKPVHLEPPSRRWTTSLEVPTASQTACSLSTCSRVLGKKLLI